MVSTRCQNPKRRPRGPEFDSRRLHTLGWWPESQGFSKRYGARLTVAVKDWQKWSARPVTGLMSRGDWKTIGTQ